MGPFVPDIITDELNLIFGFLIGIAFGFVLEQAGFSSSRKLTGLFYGKDFTVLRVFFTAAITAMSGIILLAHFGLLDMEIIYINPTYLWSAIIGGLIMGMGFVVGGYCPGTSVCGAAIGKIDAMTFIGGGIIGVFLFGELFPALENLYTSTYLGDITVPALFNITPGFFTLLIILVAVLAFIFTTKIEQRVSVAPVSKSFPVRYHKIAAIGVLALGIVLLFLPDYKTRLLEKVSDEEYIKEQQVKEITSDELAYRIIDRDPMLQIIDIRDSASYATSRLPGAQNISIEEMFGKQWHEVLKDSKLKIIVGSDEYQERRAIVLAELLGYKQFRLLKDGIKDFQHTILNSSSQARDALQPVEVSRFRAQAGILISTMIKEQASKPVRTVKLVKKIAGGCGA